MLFDDYYFYFYTPENTISLVLSKGTNETRKEITQMLGNLNIFLILILI